MKGDKIQRQKSRIFKKIDERNQTEKRRINVETFIRQI